MVQKIYATLVYSGSQHISHSSRISFLGSDVMELRLLGSDVMEIGLLGSYDIGIGL